ncbi:MAG: hypothetical protein HUJ70_08695 [Pseudobutyrivibrio sp.]|nr:hypothetical protein [Pseudobutyrivibrio sp.]
MAGGIWHRFGGILSLAEFISEHQEAIEYDLLTLANHEVDDIGRTLSWSAVNSFIQNITPESALFKEMNPEYAQWANTYKTNVILADIFDLLSQINVNLIAIGSRKPAQQPPRYPRPNQKDDSVQQVGSDALPAEELRAWFAERRGH